MELSSTLNCLDLIKNRKANGLPVYNMGLGENPLNPPELIVQSIIRHAHNKQYTSYSGIPKINKVLKNFYSDSEIIYNNILLGNGLKELLFVTQFAFSGIIYHITPSWVSYYEQINILNKNKNLVQIHTGIADNYKVSPSKLEEYLKQNSNKNNMLIFNNPCNPTGVVYNKKEVENIALVLKKYNCIVLADEIYLNLAHNNNTISIANFIPELTIRGSSLSKDMACGGYRLGWLIFPDNLNNLYKKCCGLVSSIYSCTCTPIQYAASDILSDRSTYFQICETNNLIYKFIIKKVDDILKNTKLSYIYPESAWYLFLNFEKYSQILRKKNIMDSNTLVNYLRDKLGIISVSGTKFSCSELSIRLSLIDISPHTIYNNMSNSISEKYYSNLLRGIEVLAEFLHNL